MSHLPTARRLWLPLPVMAVPVRVVLDSSSDLDALEEALLGLLRLAPRDAKELARKLHLSPSLVLSALTSLSDREIVRAPDEGGGLFACAADTRIGLAEAARPGWAFYASCVGGFLPALVVAERPPSGDRYRPSEGLVVVEGDRATGTSPKRVDLERALQMLQAAQDVFVLQSNRRAGTAPGAVASESIVEIEGERLPAFGSEAALVRVRSVVLENGAARSRGRHVAWVPIDLLPRMRGNAVPVFHEPVIDPSLQDESPIASQLRDWVERYDSAAWSALQLESERVRIDMSLVLTRAGIDSEEALEEQVDRHSLEQAERVHLDVLAPPPGDQRLLDRIREAQRWLVLAQREAAFRSQARDAWAHAVEELGAQLAEIARPHLVRWKQQKQAKTPTDAIVEQRLLLLGLRRQLGPSEMHVRRWATDPDLARRLDTAAVGAGASLTLWLLPILLLDTENARRYAGHVKIAKDRHPDLFDDLAELVAIRDYTFHEGRTRSADKLSSDLPEHIERCFMATFAALHVGLEGASSTAHQAHLRT